MRCRFDVGRQPRVTYSEAKTLQKRKTIATIAETQDRTGDLEIFSLTLSQLSYRGFRNECPLQKMMRAGTHSWRVDGCLGAERGRHYISEVAQWLACWAHNPKVPGSKPGFATQNFLHTPGLKAHTPKSTREEKLPGHCESDWCLDWASTPGLWRHREVQFLLSGDTHPRRVAIAFAHAGNRTQGTSMGGLYVATTLHALTQPEKTGRARAFCLHGLRETNTTLTLHKERTQMTLWPSG